jgi:hypothetical protein
MKNKKNVCKMGIRGRQERVMKYFKLIRSGIDVVPLLERFARRKKPG